MAKYPLFKDIANTTYYVIPPNNKYPNGHPMSNENKIVSNRSYYIQGYEGSKTGYTTESQFSFTVSASRNGQRLIVALVHSKQASYYSDAKDLLEYGFQNFELIKMYSKGDKVLDYKINNKTNVPMLASNDYYYAREKGSTEAPQMKYNNLNLEDKSFKTGDTLLTANFTFGNKALDSLNLTSGVNHIIQPKENHNNNTWKIIIIVILVFVILSFILLLFRKRNLNKKKTNKTKKYLYE